MNFILCSFVFPTFLIQTNLQNGRLVESTIKIILTHTDKKIVVINRNSQLTQDYDQVSYGHSSEILVPLSNGVIKRNQLFCNPIYVSFVQDTLILLTCLHIKNMFHVVCVSCNIYISCNNYKMSHIHSVTRIKHPTCIHLLKTF